MPWSRTPSAGTAGAPPSWAAVRRLMLWRPKPALDAEVERLEHGRQVWKGRVRHDGATRWRIDDGRRLEVNDGVTAVLCHAERGRIEAFDAEALRAHTDVKALVHAEFVTRIGDAAAHVTGAEEVVGHDCWTVEVPGFLAHEPDVAYRLAVDARTGVVLAQARLAAPFTQLCFVALTYGPALDADEFRWRGALYRDHRLSASGRSDGQGRVPRRAG